MAALIGLFYRSPFRGRGFLPPWFRGTMAPADARLPPMTHGLGVVVGGIQRFYPMARLKEGRTDVLAGRTLRIQIDPEDGMPKATWDDGSRPMQIFSRWYGFSYTYPDCELGGDGQAGAVKGS
jgi:hypothetical protein